MASVELWIQWCNAHGPHPFPHSGWKWPLWTVELYTKLIDENKEVRITKTITNQSMKERQSYKHVSLTTRIQQKRTKYYVPVDDVLLCPFLSISLKRQTPKKKNWRQILKVDRIWRVFAADPNEGTHGYSSKHVQGGKSLPYRQHTSEAMLCFLSW